MIDETYNEDEGIFSYLYRTAKLPSTDPRKPNRATRDKLAAAAIEKMRRDSLARIEFLRSCGLGDATLD